MKWARRALGMVVALVLAGCSGVPVSSDYDVDYSFAQVRHYAWLESRAEGVDPRVQNDLVDARVRRAVDDQLRARGLSKAEAPDQADLLVTYHLGQEEKLDVRTFRSHFGYYPCWHCYGPYWGPSWGYGDDLWITEYTQGTLIIDLIDARSRKLVWHGAAERRMPSFKTPADRDAWVRETVTAILERFPPGTLD